jgi:hypothetical protein
VRRPSNISQATYTVVELLLAPAISIVSFCLENQLQCAVHFKATISILCRRLFLLQAETRPQHQASIPYRSNNCCEGAFNLFDARVGLASIGGERATGTTSGHRPQPPRASETQVSQQLEAPLLSGADLTRRSTVQTPHTAHDPRSSLQGSARFRRTSTCTAKMPSTSLLYQRDNEAASNLQDESELAHLTPAEIGLVAVFSALITGVMIFCLFKFCPGWTWRRKPKVYGQPSSTGHKHTFLGLDDEMTLAESHSPGTDVKQTFLHIDEEKSLAEKKGLGIDTHPALRASNSRVKRKHGSNRNESLDSTSSMTPLIQRCDALPASPPSTYSPRDYCPKTPPPVPGTGTEVRVSPKRARPLPTPVQPIKRSSHQPSRYDISPLQTSATLPTRSQLPLSFLVEIDARREDQTGGYRNVSPLQNPPTPMPERMLSESQFSSRNVYPISAPSTTPVITYPSATPVYLPRPFSKYNPYRPALEPATSRNWPLENIPIPEHTAITTKSPVVVISPVRKHLSQSPLKPRSETTSPTPGTKSTTETTSPTPAVAVVQERPPVPVTTSLPELDPVFLEELHRCRRRQQQKPKEESQRQKRKVERESEKARKQAAVAALRPAKKLTNSAERKERGIPPNPTNPEARKDGEGAVGSRSKKSAESKSLQKASTKGQQPKHHGLLPPRLPSKSRKPSQSPDAYERARRISGLHELVGSSSLGNRG